MTLITTRPGEGPWSRTAKRCGGAVIASFQRLSRPVGWRRLFPWIDTPGPVVVGAGAIVAALLFGMAVIDAPTARAVAYLPTRFVELMNFITDFGKGAWFLWPLGIFYLLLAALPPMLTPLSRAVVVALMVRVGFLFAAIGLPGLFASLIKNMIGRARPGVSGEINPFLFDPFHWAPSYASLPSGHATTAFAAFAAIATLFPRARTAMLVYAIIIAVSRVSLKAHYVTDVLAGATVGIIGVMLVRRWFAALKLGFSIAPDGSVHQYPGPSRARIKAVARALLA